MTATSIAIVGVGKIARDQHIPTIADSDAFDLQATVSRHGGLDGVENFETLDTLLAQRPDIAAVALCMPPQARFEAAWKALQAGRHTLLEKPPGASVAEVHALIELARQKGVSLFATWHSRFAQGVEPARSWLAARHIRAARIIWKEDVRRWHPGQEWIWQPGGLGVFDPGINALSIMSEILPAPVHVTAARLDFPENREAPIAAHLTLTDTEGAIIEAEFDWRQTGPQTWDIEVDTTDGTLILTDGGARLRIDGKIVEDGSDTEYAGIYRRFASLIQKGKVDADLAPLVHVADAFMLGHRALVEPFDE